jgi:transcriptional regulator with XRE-family HTH domain
MATAGANATMMRRTLGNRLRELRVAAGLTVDQAAAKVDFSGPKITRIEKARIKATKEDVLRLIDAYAEAGDVTGADREWVLKLVVQAGSLKEWWEGRRLPPKLGLYLGLEATALVLQEYGTHLVQGLLQTPDYARALLRGTRPELLEHEIDELVEIRMLRQRVLERDDPPPLELWAVMDEAVLRRQVGGKETMHAQLEHLIAVSHKPNVTLLIMPDSMGAHPGLDGSMALLQFETGTRPVLYVEGQAGNFFQEKNDDDLRRAQNTMNQLLAAAPSPGRSLDLITKASEEMKP